VRIVWSVWRHHFSAVRVFGGGGAGVGPDSTFGWFFTQVWPPPPRLGDGAKAEEREIDLGIGLEGGGTPPGPGDGRRDFPSKPSDVEPEHGKIPGGQNRNPRVQVLKEEGGGGMCYGSTPEP